LAEDCDGPDLNFEDLGQPNDGGRGMAEMVNNFMESSKNAFVGRLEKGREKVEGIKARDLKEMRDNGVKPEKYRKDLDRYLELEEKNILAAKKKAKVRLSRAVAAKDLAKGKQGMISAPGVSDEPQIADLLDFEKLATLKKMLSLPLYMKTDYNRIHRNT
jgi:hypothetical protein